MDPEQLGGPVNVQDSRFFTTKKAFGVVGGGVVSEVITSSDISPKLSKIPMFQFTNVFWQ